MMKFKNFELSPVGEFLSKLKLQPQASRTRTKLIHLLQKKIEEYNEDLHELFLKYCELDEAGKLIANENGNYKIIPDLLAEATAAFDELENEEVNINVDEIKVKLKLLANTMENLDVTFDGQDAAIFDTLMDQLDTVTED